MTKVTEKPVPKQGSPPGRAVLRFGPYAGKRLAEVPIDYLANLRKFDGLYSTTRRQVEDHLRQLVRDPGRAKMPFGKHDGATLDDVPTSYLDWAIGTDEIELGPALRWLISAELRRRESSVPVYDGSVETITEVAHDDEGNVYHFTNTRPKVVGHVHKLPEVEDWVPYDTRGFIPSEALGGGDRKPSVWSQRRPRQQVQAEDETLNQVWNHVHGQRLLWPEGLGLPPMPILHDRRDRKRTYWSVIDGEPVIKGEDAHTDVGRLLAWDAALEALDEVGRAEDLVDLEHAHDQAIQAVEQLAQDEGWDPTSNALLDELALACQRRREQLERRETLFTDAEKRVEPADGGRVRRKGYSDENLMIARAHEAVRRMRGCKTLDDLLDEALRIRLHRDEYDNDALGYLRRWYTAFKAEIEAK
jgi:uncharacterized protein (DUF3820 family)